MSVLSRHDTVPPGITAQLDYFQGGAGFCGEPTSVFTVTVLTPPDQDYLSTPDTYEVCINGYNSADEVVSVVRDPAGRVVEKVTLSPQDLDMFNGFMFRALPTEPIGVYTFTATQGSQVATTTLVVRRATSPQFILLSQLPDGEPGAGSGAIAHPGDTIRVALDGFKPNSQVYLRIYNNPHLIDTGNVVVDYLTSYPVTVDSTGFGIWELPTAESDPEGCYELYSELVTRLTYPVPSEPSITIRWEVGFCLFKNIIW